MSAVIPAILFTALVSLSAFLAAPLIVRAWEAVLRVDWERVAKRVRVTWRQMNTDDQQVVAVQASFILMFLWWSLAIVGGW